MCGRYNVIDAPLVQDLFEILGIPMRVQTRLNIAPGAKGQIVYETNQGRTLEDAIWSLLIEPKPDHSGYRPSPKYSTFNARSGSLETSPLWEKRFHSQRAIIPASGFHEWTGARHLQSGVTTGRVLTFTSEQDICPYSPYSLQFVGFARSSQPVSSVAGLS